MVAAVQWNTICADKELPDDGRIVLVWARRYGWPEGHRLHLARFQGGWHIAGDTQSLVEVKYWTDVELPPGEKYEERTEAHFQRANFERLGPVPLTVEALGAKFAETTRVQSAPNPHRIQGKEG